MVKRSQADIKRSIQRIGWKWGYLEGWHYGAVHVDNVPWHKYRRWDKLQKDVLGSKAFEVEYESLSEHPLWVPKEQRKDFDAWQTE